MVSSIDVVSSIDIFNEDIYCVLIGRYGLHLRQNQLDEMELDDDLEGFIQDLEQQAQLEADRSSAAQAAEMPLPPLDRAESGAKSLAIVRKYLEDVSVTHTPHECS